MKRLFIFAVLVCIAALVIGTPSAAQDDERPYKVIGYFISWGIYNPDNPYFVTDVPADLLTHINYAFVNISDDGKCILGDEWADAQYSYPDDQETDELRGNFKQFLLLKEQYPHLKTLLSVGGWTWSGKFSDVALTEESRAAFAESCVAMMKQYGFDGLDIDWEYPGGGGMEGNVSRPEDTQNFTLLLNELRAQLDAQGEADGGVHYLLTIAAPAGPPMIANLELDKIHEPLDWINLMTYDFYGSWSPTTGFLSPLYASPDDPSEDEMTRTKLNTDATVQAYLDGGVPPEKIVIGVPFYGRAWGGVEDVNNGLFQPYTELPETPRGEASYGYDDLQAEDMKDYPRFWSDDAQSAWLYNPETKIMVSYEDPQSLEAKAAYVKEKGLGGMMFWELTHDDDANTLLSTIHNALNASE